MLAELKKDVGTSSVKGARLTAGCSSRFIRSNWIVNGEISHKAFELRERTRPELYVSHMIAEGATDHELSRSGNKSLRDKDFDTGGGWIALLDIEEVLDSVNDEDDDLIEYFAHGLPHCGLYFLTKVPNKLIEVRNTLRFIARERLFHVAPDGVVAGGAAD